MVSPRQWAWHARPHMQVPISRKQTLGQKEAEHLERIGPYWARWVGLKTGGIENNKAIDGCRRRCPKNEKLTLKKAAWNHSK